MTFSPFAECPTDRSDQFQTLMELTARTGKEYFTLGKEYSFHTHPRGIPYPSNTDMNTQAKLGKPLLCIGLVPQRETYCWKHGDKTDTPTCKFKEPAYKL